MCRDIDICFEEGGEDLWDVACEETGFVVYEVCKAFRIYSCFDFLDDGAFETIAKVECAYDSLV